MYLLVQSASFIDKPASQWGTQSTTLISHRWTQLGVIKGLGLDWTWIFSLNGLGLTWIPTLGDSRWTWTRDHLTVKGIPGKNCRLIYKPHGHFEWPDTGWRKALLVPQYSLMLNVQCLQYGNAAPMQDETKPPMWSSVLMKSCLFTLLPCQST